MNKLIKIVILIVLSALMLDACNSGGAGGGSKPSVDLVSEVGQNQVNNSVDVSITPSLQLSSFFGTQPPTLDTINASTVTLSQNGTNIPLTSFALTGNGEGVNFTTVSPLTINTSYTLTVNSPALGLQQTFHFRTSPIKIIHSFLNNNIDGAFPNSGVIEDSDGTLYGVTSQGGLSGQLGGGAVFSIDSLGNETVLYGSFNNIFQLNASLVKANSGTFYGVATYGGNAPSNINAFGLGGVYAITKSGVESNVHLFTGGADGYNPEINSNLITDNSGNLYGVAAHGGDYNSGVVYKIDSMNNETILYSFKGGDDGSSPTGNLVLDSSGNLYGETSNGGASGNGTIFQLNISGTKQTLYSFKGGTSDGVNPFGGLIEGQDGNLYGVANSKVNMFGGVIFKITKIGIENVLYTFGKNIKHADNTPTGGLVQDSRGNLWGGLDGGNPFHGAVYEVSLSGKELNLYSFSPLAGADSLQKASSPAGRLLIAKDGNIYGTTTFGGTADTGTVFEVVTNGQ